ncbi:MAG: tryptophan-rich sensory protein [Halothece sp.]
MLRPILTLISILAAFAVNVIANIAPPAGRTIGEISNTLFSEVQITPASYAFAIWGLIYLGLISFGIYQALPAQQNNPRLQRMDYWIVIASLAQIAWVYLFQFGLFILSLVAMIVILVSLMRVYLQLRIGVQRVSRKEKWLVDIPLSIYLAWISIATILNVALTLYDFNWNGGPISPEIWTAIMLLVATGITGVLIFQRRDIAFPLVVVWAFVAIAIRHLNTLIIAAPAFGFAIAILLLLLYKNLSPRQANPPLT